MGNPHILEKVSLSITFMLCVLVAWIMWQGTDMDQKCKDAGGVNAAGVCINPAAIIEVN